MSTGEAFNLIWRDWLPVRRADGTQCRVAPWRLTESLADNPVVAIDWPRADFNGAALELLIGLLATACPPADADDWAERWKNPPSPEALREALARIAFAFDLDGEGPRFLQELGDLDTPSERDVASLLIDSPGEQSVERHADHFVKSGQVNAISRAAAAMALFTVQAYSPAGGRGFLTSMRGGGPLTTLMAANRSDGRESLWHLVWANVPDRSGPDWTAVPGLVFPWLAPTRSSQQHPLTTPQQAHPLQAFWGMPRRVRLVFASADGRACDLGGPADEIAVIGWQTKQYGVKYEGWPHPLSPYSDMGTDKLPNPVKGNPGCVSYRHWLGLTHGDREAGRRPSACVRTFEEERADRCGDLAGMRLLAFGYDMDNMKARMWYQAEMPVPRVPPEHRGTFDTCVAQLIGAATAAADAVRRAIGRALFEASDPRFKRAFELSLVVETGESLWRATEAAFYAQLADLSQDPSDESEQLRRGWLAELRRAALAIFDDAVPSEGLEDGDWQRLVEARRGLAGILGGEKIYAALGLAKQLTGTRGGRRRRSAA